MSLAVQTHRPRTGPWLSTFVLSPVVVVMFLLRIRVLALPDSNQIVVLAMLFSALLAASLLIPVARRRAVTARHAFAVLAVGGVALGAAAIMSGRPPAVPFGPWALPISLLGAVAEEAFFRRAAYSAVEGWGGPAAAITLTALAFAAIHIPLYGTAVFPVDLGAGLLFGWQRWETGDWTVPAATHAAANLMAVFLR
jgi:membrane protease YdiL (CAAX protease family)